MARVSGGVLAGRAIAAHGIDTVFAFGRAVAVEGVRVVEARHGQTAAHAAHAWGHVNRRCGVAFVASVSGVTGAVSAIARSFVAQTPLVVIGDASRGLDAVALMKSITKWSGACERPERIPELVARAFRHALAQPRGPAYLELPADARSAETEEVDAGPSRTTARTFGDPREVMRAAELLNSAERPAVVAGDGIWWDGAWKQLALFAENGRLPTFLAGAARGALPSDHELLLRQSRRMALEAADVVCVIGTSPDAGELGDAKLVQIHADATEIGRARAPDAGIVGDCAAVLGILADGVKNVRVDREPWLQRLRDAEPAEQRAEAFDALGLGRALDESLGPGTIVIADGGEAVAAASSELRVQRPGLWLEASDGAGAAYALGVKTAKPVAQTVVLTDELAFGSGAFGYETLERLGLPVLFVVAVSGEPAGPDEVRPALRQALEATQPTIVSVAVG